MDRVIYNHCLQQTFGTPLWNMLHAGMFQWCFLLLLSFQTSKGDNERDICQKVKISGTTYQTAKEGTYHILDSTQHCDGFPSYRLDGSDDYLFYIDDKRRWSGWLVGSAVCYNLGGIAADSSARDPTKVSSQIFWQERNNNVWYISRELRVTCDDGNSLSDWEITGIVLACVFILILIILVIVCYVKKHQKGPIDPISSRTRSRHHCNHVSPRGASIWSRTSSAWTTTATSSSSTPMAQSNQFAATDRNSYNTTDHAHHSQQSTATTTTTNHNNSGGVAGPPPSYRESLEHQVYDLERIPEVNNNGSDVTQECTQSSDVSGGSAQRPVFSPPPAYSYSVV